MNMSLSVSQGAIDWSWEQEMR